MTDSGEAAIAAVERRIGYQFHDRSRLVTALTHGSAVDADGEGDDYQRLEFLGDRVLGLAVATMLMKTFAEADEGEMSRRFADLVRKETCADVSETLELDAALIVGGGKSQLATLRTRNVLGDICESVIAAIYIDGGYEVAAAFVERNWRDRMMALRDDRRNPKTELQEWAQQRGLATPVYRIVGRSGPDHHPRFTVEAEIATLPPISGCGGSRRAAEQDAAAGLLIREGVWPPKK